MRIRVLTFISLLLASSASFALAPLAPQSPINWPPKAVANQKTGKVPDFTKQNVLCLDCHKDIMVATTVKKTAKNKTIPNLHKLHLESKKIAYEGKNRDCLVCHEMVALSGAKAPKKEGWFIKGDVYHLNVMMWPPAVWKKVIVRSGEDSQPNRAETSPYTFKPTLQRLVCLQCHGPDSKIKTFYGAPEAAIVPLK